MSFMVWLRVRGCPLRTNSSVLGGQVHVPLWFDVEAFLADGVADVSALAHQAATEMDLLDHPRHLADLQALLDDEDDGRVAALRNWLLARLQRSIGAAALELELVVPQRDLDGLRLLDDVPLDANAARSLAAGARDEPLLEALEAIASG
jgi:hypothetical protein